MFQATYGLKEGSEPLPVYKAVDIKNNIEIYRIGGCYGDSVSPNYDIFILIVDNKRIPFHVPKIIDISNISIEKSSKYIRDPFSYKVPVSSICVTNIGYDLSLIENQGRDFRIIYDKTIFPKKYHGYKIKSEDEYKEIKASIIKGLKVYYRRLCKNTSYDPYIIADINFFNEIEKNYSYTFQEVDFSSYTDERWFLNIEEVIAYKKDIIAKNLQPFYLSINNKNYPEHFRDHLKEQYEAGLEEKKKTKEFFKKDLNFEDFFSYYTSVSGNQRHALIETIIRENKNLLNEIEDKLQRSKIDLETQAQVEFLQDKREEIAFLKDKIESLSENISIEELFAVILSCEDRLNQTHINNVGSHLVKDYTIKSLKNAFKTYHESLLKYFETYLVRFAILMQDRYRDRQVKLHINTKGK